MNADMQGGPPRWPAYGYGPMQPYPPPGAMPPPIQKKTEEMSVASLICGIIGVILVFPGCLCYGQFLAWLPGAAAVILGYYGRKKVRENPDAFTGDNLGLGGIITGIAAIATSLLFILLFVLAIVFNIAALSFLSLQGTQ
jgi:hypothetical protein